MTDQQYDNRYIIDAVIRDRRGVTTHVQINGKIYSVDDVIDWVRDKIYQVYTVSKEDKDRLVPVMVVSSGTNSFLRSAADPEKTDNLDWLPLATL